MKFTKRVRYVSDDGFEFHWEPLEDTLTIVETTDGYEAKYLVQDECYDVQDRDDDGLFHVNFHRDYWVVRDKIITEGDLRTWYQGGKIPQQKNYWIFPLSSLIHSGVWLKVGYVGFESDAQGWDTSHVGAVLVSKKEWRTEKKASEAAASFIEEVNEINSGAVFCCVKETFGKSKEPIDYDVVGGYVGLKHALSELKEF